VRRHGHVARLECDLLAAEARKKRRRPALEATDGLVQAEGGRLLAGLFVVAEVGRNDGVLVRDQQIAG